MRIGKWLCLFVILVLVSSCGGGGGSSPPANGGSDSAPPTDDASVAIIGFGASSDSVVAGDSVTLTAEFTGGTGNIDNGVGNVISNAPVIVTPVATTLYTLTVTDGVGATTTATLTVNVTDSTLTSAYYFRANDGVNGAELWKTTGSAATTEMVLDINPGAASSGLQGFFKFNNAVYFKANDGAGVEIWKTTDSVPGAVKVSNFNNGVNLFPSASTIEPGKNRMVIYNNKLFFAADNGVTGSELWSIDVSDTVTLEADIGDSVSGSRPAWLTVYNNKLYFSAANVQGNIELWVFDDSTGLPSLVKDIFPGNDQSGFPQASQPAALTVYNDTLYFNASFSAGAFIDTELYQSKGDSVSTVLFTDISQGASRSIPKDFDPTPAGMFFWARNGGFNYELYLLIANGNPQKVKNIYASTNNDYVPSSHRGVYMNNAYYFPQYDGNSVQIWKTDGTAVATTQVTTIPSGIVTPGIFVTGPKLVADSTGQYLYFSAVNGLWVLDTVDDSFQLLMDENTPNSQVGNLNMVDDTVYFSASDGVSGKELWRSEDVPDSAVLVKDINIGASDSQ